MTITFKSVIKHPEHEEKVIEFTSPVKTSEEYGFAVYEFVEPSRNVMNRIEVAPNGVNIFAGPSSINLSLNEETSVTYETPQGNIYLTSLLQKLKIEKSKIFFQYTLNQASKLIGEYNITLTISSNKE